jgi:hypothetical protein
MQGGCLCENLPGLRLDTNNVEIASTIAPRPLLMISATGDWTKETMEMEYPAVRSIYQLYGAGDRVHAIRVDAEHNYNKPSREAMYAWMVRWLKRGPADARIEEKGFSVEPLQNLLVFHQRPMPDGAATQQQLVHRWIEAAKAQLGSSTAVQRTQALRSALGYAPIAPARVDAPPPPKRPVTVLIDAADAALERELSRRGFHPLPIRFTPYDEAAALKIRHFETYNRTPASQRVADIVSALEANPGAAIVARGDAALAAVFARTIARASAAVLDVDAFDPANDEDYLKRLFIPGLRRAGGFETAGADRTVLMHNTNGRFAVKGFDTEARRLTPREIAEAVAARVGR